jgi:hypothetical protein
MAEKKPSIALDFDGVLHSYTSGWTGVVPKDPPVEGALEFFKWLVDAGFTISIFSTRANSPVGVRAIRNWMLSYGFPIGRRTISAAKPNADIYVDDRGFRFEGDFNAVKTFLEKNNLNPKPWYK